MEDSDRRAICVVAVLRVGKLLRRSVTSLPNDGKICIVVTVVKVVWVASESVENAAVSIKKWGSLAPTSCILDMGLSHLLELSCAIVDLSFLGMGLLMNLPGFD